MKTEEKNWQNYVQEVILIFGLEEKNEDEKKLDSECLFLIGHNPFNNFWGFGCGFYHRLHLLVLQIPYLAEQIFEEGNNGGLGFNKIFGRGFVKISGYLIN
ncbi:MAG: hypothetical protein R2747_03665 [Pyrinomonadaceae bacterium]